MSNASTSPPAPSSAAIGILYAVDAYGSWGLLPVYWKALARVPVVEVLAHRVVWSTVFAAVLVTALGGWRGVRDALSSRHTSVTILATSLLIGVNWGLRALLLGAGAVTGTPLLWFASAARRLRLTTPSRTAAARPSRSSPSGRPWRSTPSRPSASTGLRRAGSVMGGRCDT